jgi:hypothetical protein
MSGGTGCQGKTRMSGLRPGRQVEDRMLEAKDVRSDARMSG